MNVSKANHIFWCHAVGTVKFITSPTRSTTLLSYVAAMDLVWMQPNSHFMRAAVATGNTMPAAPTDPLFQGPLGIQFNWAFAKSRPPQLLLLCSSSFCTSTYIFVLHVDFSTLSARSIAKGTISNFWKTSLTISKKSRHKSLQHACESYIFTWKYILVLCMKRPLKQKEKPHQSQCKRQAPHIQTVLGCMSKRVVIRPKSSTAHSVLFFCCFF